MNHFASIFFRISDETFTPPVVIIAENRADYQEMVNEDRDNKPSGWHHVSTRIHDGDDIYWLSITDRNHINFGIKRRALHYVKKAIETSNRS